MPIKVIFSFICYLPCNDHTMFPSYFCSKLYAGLRRPLDDLLLTMSSYYGWWFIIRMIIFVPGMPFCCQHKALTIFRAKGRVPAALRAQLWNTEPVGLQITHTHRAKGQRPKKRGALLHPQHCNCSAAGGPLGTPPGFTAHPLLYPLWGGRSPCKDLYITKKTHCCNL